MRRRWICGWIAAALLLAGCTGSEPAVPEPSATPSASEASEEPPRAKPLGVLKVGFVGAPATLDPYSREASDLTRTLVRPLLPSLYRLLPDGSAAPSLAGSISEFDGGVRITLTEANWSDGTRVTAKDVVASAGRARRSGQPTGFDAVDSARAVGQFEVELRGAPDDWPDALAAGTYVLPNGKWVPSKTAGPFEVARYQPNFQLTLQAAPGAQARTKKVQLKFFEDQSSLLASLETGHVDAAPLPSTVNLASRLERSEIEFDSAAGWEWVGVRALEPGAAGTMKGLLDLELLQESFIRSEGAIAGERWPTPEAESGATEPFDYSGGAPLTLAAPLGDELLGLMQRAIQLQAKEAQVEMQIPQIEAATFYGSWQQDAPVEALLMRSLGAPHFSSHRPGAGPDVPMFLVPTYLAFGRRVDGAAANPTIEGPLWNLDDWQRAEPEEE